MKFKEDGLWIIFNNGNGEIRYAVCDGMHRRGNKNEVLIRTFDETGGFMTAVRMHPRTFSQALKNHEAIRI